MFATFVADMCQTCATLMLRISHMHAELMPNKLVIDKELAAALFLMHT